MYIIKLLNLVIVLLTISSLQSCLKNSSSKLKSDEETENIYLYRYISEDKNNYICQYKCSSTSPRDAKDKNCNRFIIDISSSKLNENTINIIKQYATLLGDKDLNLPLNDIISLVHIKADTDEKELCKIKERVQVPALALTKNVFDILNTLSSSQKINDDWEKFKYKYTYKGTLYDNDDTIFLYNHKTEKFILKGASPLAYNDASAYCCSFTNACNDSGDITDHAYSQYIVLIKAISLKTLVFKDRILEFLNFKDSTASNESDCIFVYNQNYNSKMCYKVNNMETSVVLNNEQHPFLCEGFNLIKQTSIEGEDYDGSVTSVGGTTTGVEAY